VCCLLKLKNIVYQKIEDLTILLYNCEKGLHIMKRLISLLPLTVICIACSNTKPYRPKYLDSPIKVEDGLCQPIYEMNEYYYEHDPETSTIARFTVYIETDYDTDLDGKNDLVKSFVQLPKAILEKGARVASILEFSPYTAGTIEAGYIEDLDTTQYVTYKNISRAGSKRPVTSEIDLLSHNNNMDINEFCYFFDEEKSGLAYTGAIDCDYFLARGFAFIDMGGYGTYGSDGLETVGTRLESHAYSCLIDWLNGERVGFSDYEGTHTIKATFSNGSYGAQGCSYLGTTAYQLACMNLKGLKAVIPSAGIASWYEYTNSQGIAQYTSPNCASLSIYCSSRFLQDNVSEEIMDTYGGYIRYMYDMEQRANGDYSDFWKRRDYTVDVQPSCPALINHGVNDFNVPVRNAALMYKTFKEAGQNAKLILHQGGHTALHSNNYSYSIDNYKESFNEVANRWYSHYLYDVDNGVENMPDFIYQSNVDGLYYEANDIFDIEKKAITLSNPTRETVTSKDMEFYFKEWNDSNYDIDNKNSIIFDLGKAQEDMQINGIADLKINLKTTDIGRDGLPVEIVLLDTYEETFPAYGANNFTVAEGQVTDESFEIYPGREGVYYEYIPEETNVKMITSTSFDLCNPGTRSFGEHLPKTKLKSNESYEYQVYFEPATYTLKKGHTLKCVLFTFNPGLVSRYGLFKEADEDEYTGEGDVILKPKEWTTTESYGYTVDMNKAPILSLPY